MPQVKICSGCRRQTAITDFSNNKSRVKYALNTAEDYSVDSGITDLTCQVIVKQRFCGSGIKWKEPGSAFILRPRAVCVLHTAYCILHTAYYKVFSRTSEPVPEQGCQYSLSPAFKAESNIKLSL